MASEPRSGCFRPFRPFPGREPYRKRGEGFPVRSGFVSTFLTPSPPRKEIFDEKFFLEGGTELERYLPDRTGPRLPASPGSRLGRLPVRAIPRRRARGRVVAGADRCGDLCPGSRVDCRRGV
jgi:hypothetical protein